MTVKYKRSDINIIFKTTYNHTVARRPIQAECTYMFVYITTRYISAREFNAFILFASQIDFKFPAVSGICKIYKFLTASILQRRCSSKPPKGVQYIAFKATS